MGGQEECSPFDASTQTRILTPFSESLLSSHEVSVVKSKRRKMESGAMEDLLNDSFVVKPHPSTVFSKPHILTPLALISRIYVPFSCLDILSPSGILPASRFFEAHVKILELEERMGNTPMVLIARLDDGKSHFVVERVEQNLHVLCKLSSWVKLGQLCAKAVVSRHQLAKVAAQEIEAGSGLPEHDGESQATSESRNYSKKKRLAIEAIQSMVKRPSRELLSNAQTALFPPEPGTVMEIQSRGQKTEAETIQEDIVMRPMATEIFDNIRSQYYEALYLSKASLAYFAKGPLSRARAAFHLDYDSTLDMNDLVTFLESLILPANVVDKKYKDGVPNVLSRFIMLDGSAEETIKTPAKPMKLKSKKMKPGKNGLYPVEDTYICRWWGSHDSEAYTDAPGESKEEIMRRITQLRIRETQLQMIVILETLALRPLATSTADRYGELPSIGQTDGITDGKTITCSKSKKPLDLAVLIEVHVDRLCIWQSLAAEEGRTASTVGEGSNADSRPKALANSHDHAADLLREFCVEVVVPFFSARLPEQCGTISRKLGGPVVASPVRPMLKTHRSSIAAPRPGGITKRRTAAKPRKSLRRVLTDERHAREGSRGTSGAISLMRSATASTFPGLKREGSETPLLSNIPSADTQAMLVSRGGVLKSKKFSQREVDLNSLSSVNDAKMKKANIEAELKDAISALKRPNRQLAAQLQVETAEKLAASISLRSKKSKKPMRNPSFQGVQILSTPKGNRQKEATAISYPIHELTSEQDHELEVIPPSSIPRIPLSAARTANNRESEQKSLCKATPARSRPGTHLATGSQNYGGLPSCSPLQAKCSRKQQLLHIPAPFAARIGCTPRKMVTVHATPCKQEKTNTLPEDAPMYSLNITIEAAGMEETENTDISGVPRDGARNVNSIYKSLGWDDYDDIA